MMHKQVKLSLCPWCESHKCDMDVTTLKGSSVVAQVICRACGARSPRAVATFKEGCGPQAIARCVNRASGFWEKLKKGNQET